MDEVPIEPKPRKNAGWWKKFLYSYRTFPDKKQYIEFFTALLTVPVLLTVILLNVNNLRTKESTQTPTPTPAERVIYISPKDEDEAVPTPTSSECNDALPPVEIQYPEEGDTISDNPVAISIFYPRNNFCAIVWSYRINSGRWSDFDDKSIALFNLPKGKVNFELRVKSLSTGEEKTLKRSFTYEGDSDNPTPTLSATQTPSPTSTM